MTKMGIPYLYLGCKNAVSFSQNDKYSVRKTEYLSLIINYIQGLISFKRYNRKGRLIEMS